MMQANEPTARTKVPGLPSAMHERIESTARKLVTNAMLRGVRLSSVILHLEPDGVKLVTRRELAAQFDDDVPDLARRLRATPTPPGTILAFVNCDETEIVSVPLTALGCARWGR